MQKFFEGADIVGLLKAYAEQKDLHKGNILHAHILHKGLLAKNNYIGSALVHMYSKCAAVTTAAAVLDELPARDVVSWSALITGFAQLGQGEVAIKYFEHMQHEAVCPDRVTFICILKACGSIGAFDKGEKIHCVIAKQGLLKDTILGNALVDMYAKCGALVKARRVLEELPVLDVVSWNALIAGYVQYEQADNALECFVQMQQNGLSSDSVTFICILKACGSIKAVDKGEEIHCEVLRRGLLGRDTVLGNALVNMYAKCGELEAAAHVLKKLPIQDVISWNALLLGLAQQGEIDKVLEFLGQMQCKGISPDSVTFVCILKACGMTKMVEKGKQVHDMIVQEGLLMENTTVGNSLVDMYVKCGALPKAAEVHDKFVTRSVVSWNSLISGYVQQGQESEALKCFERMQAEGFSPDIVTLSCMLKACGGLGDAYKGQQIHDLVVKMGLIGTDVLLGTTLIDMYARCGALEKAEQVLKELPVRDAICWSALIAGYAQDGQGWEALKCFEQMQYEGFLADNVTFICILKACGSIGAAGKGEQIYREIVKQGLLGGDILLGNAVLDMYVKCGVVAQAEFVFDQLPLRDIVSWNALLAGYAHHGQGEEALKCFLRLQCEGFSPDMVTLTCLLSVCSHSRLLGEAQTCFMNMIKKYGLTPAIEHHSCMVDVFGRAGEFKEAIAVIKKMHYLDHLPIWLALLSACRACGNVILGRLAFDKAVQIDKTDAAAYSLMAEIYASAGMRDLDGIKIFL